MQVSLTKTESMYDVEMSVSALKMLVDMGWKVEDIDGHAATIMTCENCGLPIMENDQYEDDGEGVYWHVTCPEPEEDCDWPNL